MHRKYKNHLPNSMQTLLFFKPFSPHSLSGNLCILSFELVSEGKCKRIKNSCSTETSFRFVQSLIHRKKGRNDQNNPPPIDRVDNILASILSGVLVKSKYPAYFSVVP